jgi:hypothetical protein
VDLHSKFKIVATLKNGKTFETRSAGRNFIERFAKELLYLEGLDVRTVQIYHTLTGTELAIFSKENREYNNYRF